MCLYGGGFLSFFLSSWSCFISFSAWSSLKRSAASVRAMKTKHVYFLISMQEHIFTYKTQLMDTITYPFCTLHLPPFPFSLYCEYHPPCRGRLWPGTSTQNLWSQRIAPGTLPPHVSSLGCYLEHLWPDRLLQATTWRIRSGFRNSNTGTLTVT